MLKEPIDEEESREIIFHVRRQPEQPFEGEIGTAFFEFFLAKERESISETSELLGNGEKNMFEASNGIKIWWEYPTADTQTSDNTTDIQIGDKVVTEKPIFGIPEGTVAEVLKIDEGFVLDVDMGLYNGRRTDGMWVMKKDIHKV